jgi:hypothetical protein
MKFPLPSSLRGGVHSLEDAIITLSGPGIALSGIIAGVDLLTGGHAMESVPWLTVSWAICLLLSLDFQVLALGARAHKVYLSSEKSTGRKVVEIVLSLVIAAAISYVSIQMQSIVAKMNASGLTIDQATTALGIDPNALIFERSILVLVLIFLSGWFRHEGREPVNHVNQLNQGIEWSKLEEWFTMTVQMNQGMLNQVNQGLLVQLAAVVQTNQDGLNQLNQEIGGQLARVVQVNQERLNQLDQRLTATIAQAQLNQEEKLTRLVQGQLDELVNQNGSLHQEHQRALALLGKQLSQGQERQMEAVFSRCIEQVFVREERPGRQSTNGRLRAIPAPGSPVQPSEPVNQAAILPSPMNEQQLVQGQDGASALLNQLASSGGSEEGTRIWGYLDQCKATGSPEPSLTQIEGECQVSRNTAIAWRRQWKERQALLVPSGK